MASRFSSVPSSFAALRRRPAALGAAAFLLGALGLLAASGCTLSTSGIDDGTGGTSSTTTTGTGGGPVCTDPSDCADGNPCTDDLCTKGKCENPPNDKVEPTDTNPCTDDICDNGTLIHPNTAINTSCGVGLVCNGNGGCVGCTANNQCNAPETCGGCGVDFFAPCAQTGLAKSENSKLTSAKCAKALRSPIRGVKCGERVITGLRVKSCCYACCYV